MTDEDFNKLIKEYDESFKRNIDFLKKGGVFFRSDNLNLKQEGLLHKSAKEKGKLQFTVFDQRGPVLDFNCSDLETVAKKLTNDYSHLKPTSKHELSYSILKEGKENMAAYKKKDPEQKKKEVESLTKDMEKQIDNYFVKPEEMKEYLSFMGRFYKYSSNNIALIQDQFPGAKAVGSFKFWKDHGFAVQKGEKGIKVLVPNQLQPKFQDEKGQWKLLKEANEAEKKKIELGQIKPTAAKLYFSVGHVFDISQTNATADDLPKIFPNKWLEGDVKNYSLLYKGMEQIAKNNNFKIIEPIYELGAAKGVSYTDLKAVALNPRNTELQNAKTLLHELAHQKLHTTETRDNYSKHEREFQAEMTAYTVSSYLGLDTSEYSLGYLASWTQGKEFKDKVQLLKEVRETSMEFINTIEDVVEKEKTIEQEKENVLNNTSGINSQQKSSVNLKENINQKELEDQSPTLFLTHFAGITSTQEKSISVNQLRQEVNKEDSPYKEMEHENMTDREFVQEFNALNKHRFAAILENEMNSPAILIQWSENDNFKSNELIPFGEANERMKKVSKEVESREGYDKTRYHVILPKELSPNNKISIINMDRLDLGDGLYKSPLEQIYCEKRLDEPVLNALRQEAEKMKGLEKEPVSFLQEKERKPVNRRKVELELSM